MNELINDGLVPIFTNAGIIAFFMALCSKGVNLIIKAFSRGEMVV